jgi:hypothetical protein
VRGRKRHHKKAWQTRMRQTKKALKRWPKPPRQHIVTLEINGETARYVVLRGDLLSRLTDGAAKV